MPNKNGYILSCIQGDNSDLFPDILKLYVPEGSLALDMTWGNGVFWKKVDYKLIIGGSTLRRTGYNVVANDIDPARGDYHLDFKSTGFASDWFDAVILDPPYLHVGGFKTLKKSLDMGYNNAERAIGQKIVGSQAVHQMYYDGMKEAYRILKDDGTLIIKCQDQVESGKQQWSHIIYHNYGTELGFYNEDQFILMSKVQPLMRHKPDQQKHARRNHSMFLVFRKRS